jgi:hypothetical protein
MSSEHLSRRLFSYFKLSFPRPHSWFGEVQQAVSIANCFYEANAAHTDLAPWATFAQRNFQGEQGKAYESLLEREVKGLSDLVRFSSCLKLVIIFPWGRQRELAMSAVKNGFSGRVETVGKDDLTAWFWDNNEELRALIHS